MGDEKVADHGRKSLGVRRDVLRHERRDQDGGVGNLPCIAPVTADDCIDLRAYFTRMVHRCDEIRGEIRRNAATADGQGQDSVSGAEPRAAQPFDVRRIPTVVVDTRGELGDVVGRRVGLEAAELAGVVDGMSGVRGRAPDAEDEQPAALVTHLRETGGEALDRLRIQLTHDPGGLLEVALREAHDGILQAAKVLRPNLCL
jgi:hypothetical protein